MDQNSAVKGIKICFVVDHVLQHYRVPLMRYLVEKGYDITICYPSYFKRRSPSLEELAPGLSESVQAVPLRVRKFGGFYYFGVKNPARFDVIICMQNLRVIDFWKVTLNPFKKYKLIHWGIGVTSFDKKSRLTTSARNFLALFADKLILYSDEAQTFYMKKLISKIAVAHNTIENRRSEDFSGNEKDCFLFIGQLDKRKGITNLMKAFSDYLQNAAKSDIQKLVIIGDGEMADELHRLAKELQITDNVVFTGSLKEDKLKWEYFKRAQLCISMKQAGLAVLESFSYGVPFVTSRSAVTGGERFNIQHKNTGFFVESVQDLTDLLHYTQENREEIKQIGSNAYDFYQQQRSSEKMAGVFDDVIREVMGN